MVIKAAENPSIKINKDENSSVEKDIDWFIRLKVETFPFNALLTSAVSIYLVHKHRTVKVNDKHTNHA